MKWYNRKLSSDSITTNQLSAGNDKYGLKGDNEVQPSGELTFEEDVSGGLGRHLGFFSTTLLVVGRIIGTGIFSTPSSILTSVGSVGAAMLLWVLGAFLSFAGMFVWLEFATMIPRSGGEKNYLEFVYKRPKLLTSVLFAFNAILLGFTASGCIVFANNILVAANVTASPWHSRAIAVGVISFVTIIHGFTPKFGVRLMNALSIFKVLILLLVVVSGWVVLAGGIKAIPDPHRNFQNSFNNSSHSPYQYASAIFKILNSYTGWSNAFYVMNEIRDPIRTVKFAAPLGLGICTLLYIFANISYFAAVDLPALKASGVTVASYYFLIVFGHAAQRALSVFVALSALGNVMTVTFAQSRVNQEIAKEGVLPFAKLLSSNWPVGSPFAGLMVHYVPSFIIIIAPPAGIVYSFILDVEGYPTQVINLFVVLGLLYLRWKRPDLARPFKIWLPLAFFFLAAAVFLLIVPFLRPPGGIGDTPPLPYWLYPIVGLAVFILGILYWAVWIKLLPHIGNYSLRPIKETLSDGTVYTIFVKDHLE